MIFHVTKYAHNACDFWAVGCAVDPDSSRDGYDVQAFHTIVPYDRASTSPNFWLEDEETGVDTFEQFEVDDLPDNILAKYMEYCLCQPTL